jgi:tRNA modification GTPase
LLTDTAGLRATDDEVEAIGVQRASRLVAAADILVWMGEPDDAPDHSRPINLHAKADLPDRGAAPAGSIAISSVSGQGIAELLARIEALARTLLPAEDSIALNRRQAEQLEEAAAALAAAAGEHELVLIAEQLRSARGAFDRLTGRAGVENVLDALFARFCLGK